ncbi:glutamine--tRNA ligase/YqeY domain fusion protein [Niameybacter sp.]|uniref:glutamine--tRNA ligase/YqeY domain fusion protein n=1 Tax=Niameybacter sp. TaxID=2033640 RepID=UPI003FA57D29
MEKDYLNFVDWLVKEDVEQGVCKEVHTRFPPEPNGYLHIGSAYAINISYSLAKKYGGKFNLRFDDTNPGKEDIAYVNGIKEDMAWMGFDYENRMFFGSDYSEQIYQYALQLIKDSKAYVCDLGSEEMRIYRGSLTSAGTNSPYRDRSIEENLLLFENMRAGKYDAGEKTLRAKIDMAHPNMNMRDPVIYRISYTPHYRTGESWCIYPMYDYAHPIQDYLEGISHSLCSAEFADHRPLYEWVLNHLKLEHTLPRQIEFGRMNLSGVVMSKRYLKALVANHAVEGWDDPRMPTLKGLRRRGYTREAILDFLGEIGVSKGESLVDVAMLESALRNDLKDKVPAVMTVLDPLKVVITNLSETHLEYVEAWNNPANETLGSRKLPFTKELYIERADFSENPPKKYNRLVLGGEVRLMHAYFIKCHEVIKDDEGHILELRCTYDPATKSGTGFTERKVKGTIHWVSKAHSMLCEVRLFEDLFLERPTAENLLEVVNPKSKQRIKGARIERSGMGLNKENRCQFIRHGYFIEDTQDSTEDAPVFNQTVSLKSSYKKEK